MKLLTFTSLYILGKYLRMLTKNTWWEFSAWMSMVFNFRSTYMWDWGVSFKSISGEEMLVKGNSMLWGGKLCITTADPLAQDCVPARSKPEVVEKKQRLCGSSLPRGGPFRTPTPCGPPGTGPAPSVTNTSWRQQPQHPRCLSPISSSKTTMEPKTFGLSVYYRNC